MPQAFFKNVSVIWAELTAWSSVTRFVTEKVSPFDVVASPDRTQQRPSRMIALLQRTDSNAHHWLRSPLFDTQHDIVEIQGPTPGIKSAVVRFGSFLRKTRRRHSPGRPSGGVQLAWRPSESRRYFTRANLSVGSLVSGSSTSPTRSRVARALPIKLSLAARIWKLGQRRWFQSRSGVRRLPGGVSPWERLTPK